MQFFWKIISLYVLILTLESGVKFFFFSNVATASCCTNDSCDDTEEKNCADNSCNPFQSCSNCMPFTLIDTDVKFATPDLLRNSFCQFHFFFNSNAFIDFWQPPKLA